MKRWILRLAMAALAAVVLMSAVCAQREPDAADEEALRQITQDFLMQYTENVFLYTDHALTQNTSLQLPQQTRDALAASKQDFPPLTQASEQIDAAYTDNMDYVLEKADYLKYMRLAQGIERRDFESTCVILGVRLVGEYAQVYAGVETSFYYDDQTVRSALGERFELLLKHVDGAWRIFYVSANDTYDSAERFASFSAYTELAGASEEYTALATQQAEQITQDFLMQYTENVFLYTDHALTQNTSLQLPQQTRDALAASKQDFPPLTQASEQIDTAYTDNMDYVLEKAAYLKYMRQAQGIGRRDFESMCVILGVRLAGEYAQVYAGVETSFYYDDQTVRSALGERFELLLKRVGGTWVIFYVSANDTYDSVQSFATFSGQAQVARFNAIHFQGSVAYGPYSVAAPMGVHGSVARAARLQVYDRVDLRR